MWQFLSHLAEVKSLSLEVNHAKLPKFGSSVYVDKILQ